MEQVEIARRDGRAPRRKVEMRVPSASAKVDLSVDVMRMPQACRLTNEATHITEEECAVVEPGRAPENGGHIENT